jgi:hypothetical protein
MYHRQPLRATKTTLIFQVATSQRASKLGFYLGISISLTD